MVFRPFVLLVALTYAIHARSYITAPSQRSIPCWLQQPQRGNNIVVTRECGGIIRVQCQAEPVTAPWILQCRSVGSDQQSPFKPSKSRTSTHIIEFRREAKREDAGEYCCKLNEASGDAFCFYLHVLELLLPVLSVEESCSSRAPEMTVAGNSSCNLRFTCQITWNSSLSDDNIIAFPDVGVYLERNGKVAGVPELQPGSSLRTRAFNVNFTTAKNPGTYRCSCHPRCSTNGTYYSTDVLYPEENETVPEKNDNTTTYVLIIVCLASAGVAVLLAVASVFCYRRRNQCRNPAPMVSTDQFPKKGQLVSKPEDPRGDYDSAELETEC